MEATGILVTQELLEMLEMLALRVGQAVEAGLLEPQGRAATPDPREIMRTLQDFLVLAEQEVLRPAAMEVLEVQDISRPRRLLEAWAELVAAVPDLEGPAALGMPEPLAMPELQEILELLEIPLPMVRPPSQHFLAEMVEREVLAGMEAPQGTRVILATPESLEVVEAAAVARMEMEVPGLLVVLEMRLRQRPMGTEALRRLPEMLDLLAPLGMQGLMGPEAVREILELLAIQETSRPPMSMLA